jgi:hypothetical protein
LSAEHLLDSGNIWCQMRANRVDSRNHWFEGPQTFDGQPQAKVGFRDRELLFGEFKHWF